MPKIDEAMALAGMNPMIGMSGPHHASFIVNVMNHDKDLGDDGKILTGVSKSLDMDDNLYGIDQNGRFFAKRKYDVMERKDIIECYKVNVDCTTLIESIEKEIQIPYDMRPVHKPSYIYESLTGHTLLDENQMEYDTLCEKVQLDKMTAALAGVTQGSLQRAHNMQTGKQDKEAGYIPDNDFPQGTENMSVPGMVLESKELGDSKYTDCCKAFVNNFNELFPEYASNHPKIGGPYNTDKGYPYIAHMEVQGIRSPKRVLDWYEYMLKSIYDKLIEQGYSVIYDGADNGGRSIKYETKEVAAEEYEPDTQDLQYLKEVANTKFYEESVEPSPSSIQSKVDDCNIICKGLDEREQDIGVDGIENKNILFIDVKYDGSKPIGFVVCKKPYGKDLNKRVKDCYTLIAVDKEYRGRGIATSLVKSLIQWFKRSNYEQLIWGCHITNKASNALAQKCGFTYGWKKDNGKSNVYLITNPSKLKAIGEGSLDQHNDLKYLREVANTKFYLESSNIDKPKDTYEGMKTDQDEAEWRKKIVNIPLDHDALLKLGYSEEYANKPQPCIMVNGKKYRARAELLLLNDKGEVLIQRGKWRGGFNYTLCGGGVDDPKYHITKTAIRECEEEALVVPKNVMFSGIVWFMKYHSDTVVNDGAVVFVCVGEYDRPYKGYVKKIDRDSFAQKAKWVNIKQANLGEPHKLALQVYLENKKTDVHEGFQPNNQDLKYLREVANTKFYVEGETMYTMSEESGYRPNPIVFSDDDVYVNFDNFTNKKEHALLITGLSGSGKSTLGKKLADQYNAYYVETDIIAFKLMKDHRQTWDYIQDHDKMLYKYLKQHNFTPAVMSDIGLNNYKTSKKKIWEDRVNEYIKWLISGQKERVVIAGGNVGVFLQDYPQYAYIPTIFKGTSLFKSIWRRVNRSEDSIFDQLKRSPMTFKQYQDMWREMKNSRANVMSTNEWEFVKESVTLEDGLFKSMGIINEAKPDSNTTIPFKTVEESNEQPVDESVFNAISLKGGPHLTLYHGSPDKHKQVLPTSFSVGNRTHDPSWSVFMFDDKRLAMAYAIGNTIGVIHGNWIDREKLSPPIGWIEKDGLLKYKPVNIVDEKDWDKIKNHIIGTKFYVYTLEVPIDKDLNIVGTAVSLPEYTYTGVPKVVKCEEFTMTKEILDMQYKPLPTAEYQKWKAKKMGKKSVYGPWIKYFVNMTTRGTKRKLVLKTLKLEPGSDLSFINDIIGPDDVHNNVGKWLEDKYKILYIVGLSGSGKTTMSNKLGKLLDVKVIHVDEVHHALSKANGGGDKWRAKCNAQERRDMLWKEVMKRAGNDKCIIEGGPMILYKVSELEKQPFIIPGTSTITSTYRMIKRTLSNDPKQGLPAFLRDYKNKSKFEMVSKMLKIISSCAIGNLKIGSQLDELKSKVTLEDGMMSLLGVKK